MLIRSGRSPLSFEDILFDLSETIVLILYICTLVSADNCMMQDRTHAGAPLGHPWLSF